MVKLFDQLYIWFWYHFIYLNPKKDHSRVESRISEAKILLNITYTCSLRNIFLGTIYLLSQKYWLWMALVFLAKFLSLANLFLFLFNDSSNEWKPEASFILHCQLTPPWVASSFSTDHTSNQHFVNKFLTGLFPSHAIKLWFILKQRYFRLEPLSITWGLRWNQ